MLLWPHIQEVSIPIIAGFFSSWRDIMLQLAIDKNSCVIWLLFAVYLLGWLRSFLFMAINCLLLKFTININGLILNMGITQCEINFDFFFIGGLSYPFATLLISNQALNTSTIFYGIDTDYLISRVNLKLLLLLQIKWGFSWNRKFGLVFWGLFLFLSNFYIFIILDHSWFNLFIE